MGVARTRLDLAPGPDGRSKEFVTRPSHAWRTRSCRR